MMEFTKAGTADALVLSSISRRAFESDIAVGALSKAGPPGYRSVSFYTKMARMNHLYKLSADGLIAGGALLFADGLRLNIGRIFVDPEHFRKGYGIFIMQEIEKIFPDVEEMSLDTPVWNVRTNTFYQKLGYVNIEAFEMVDKGEKLAVYHPAEKGTNGKNIYGKTIHAEKGMEKKPLRGTGFIIAPDGVTYISKLNGKFEYINGRMIISNMLVVHEDVTSVTGKLEVDGSVYVVGSIYSGGYIKATGDIIIEHNVETARLIAGGNVMIKKGSCSRHDCFIEAGGEVSGKFFEAANINARGNVKANYIMNSNINTQGRVIVSGSKGVLLGGRICAVKGVDTFNLGNSSHLKTILEVGRNELYENQQAEFAEKREQILNELSALEMGRNKIIQLITAEKEVPEDVLRKVCATITVKSQELANLDAEVSKLANLTEQNFIAPVCVRGKAHVGSTIVINTIKYMLSMEVNRVIFKLRNKQVIIVTL